MTNVTSSDNSVNTSTSTASYACFDDPLFLSQFDRPTQHITPYQFDGTKFLSWKRDAYIALISKNKEGFVDGTTKMPPLTDKMFHQWKRCDYMVMKWLSNSLIPSIKETVEYVSSSHELWTELVERYGQVNSIEVYQLRKELNATHQSNSSVIEYYSKMKKTWETLDAIDPIPLCNYGAMDACSCSLLKRIVARESNNKLIQFLMGLNSGYDTIKTNVLSMEPLPTLNKAFSVLQKVERQKQVSATVEVLTEASAYASHKNFHQSQSDSKKPRLDSESEPKKVKRCTHCNGAGHEVDKCWKLQTCTHCGRKGHIIEYCHDLRNQSRNGGYNGKSTYTKPPDVHFGKGRNVYKRTAHNAAAIPGSSSAVNTSDQQPDNSPLDFFENDEPTPAPSSTGVVVDPQVLQNLAQNIYQQVLQSLSDNGASTSLNSAGPFQ